MKSRRTHNEDPEHRVDQVLASYTEQLSNQVMVNKRPLNVPQVTPCLHPIFAGRLSPFHHHLLLHASAGLGVNVHN